MLFHLKHRWLTFLNYKIKLFPKQRFHIFYNQKVISVIFYERIDMFYFLSIKKSMNNLFFLTVIVYKCERRFFLKNPLFSFIETCLKGDIDLKNAFKYFQKAKKYIIKEWVFHANNIRNISQISFEKCSCIWPSVLNMLQFPNISLSYYLLKEKSHCCEKVLRQGFFKLTQHGNEHSHYSIDFSIST